MRSMLSKVQRQAMGSLRRAQRAVNEGNRLGLGESDMRSLGFTLARTRLDCSDRGISRERIYRVR